MRRRITLALTVICFTVLPLGIAACGEGSGGDSASAADTLTRRQKDELISDMPIPGAGGVGRALDAQDKANARTAQHDSIR